MEAVGPASEATCRLCLSSERKLSSVQDVRWAYNVLTDDQASAEALVCWECRAVLRKFLALKSRALRAGKLLQAAHHRITDAGTVSIKHLSSLCARTKTWYDADYTWGTDAHDADPESKYIVPKIELEGSDYIAEIEVWADPAVPEYTDSDCKPPARPQRQAAGRRPKRAKRVRSRPVKDASAGKVEAFTVTSEELSAYRHRACGDLQAHTHACPTCALGFTTKDRLDKHNARYHTDTAGDHVCDICSSRFPSKESASRHTAAHYTMYRCRYAGCQFIHPSCANVRGHYTTHKPHEKVIKSECTHQCDLCEKQYRTAQGLSVHRKTHTSDRTYECHHCGKTFKTRTQIHLHMPSHTLKVMCDVCGKRLSDRRRLKLHTLAHLDPSHRPHECTECHKRFIDRYKLLVHSRQHTGEKPFKCESCLTEYVSKEQLTQHVKKHHTDGGDAKKKVYKPRTKSMFRNERIFPGRQQKRLPIKQEADVKAPDVSDKYQCSICGKRLSTYQNLQSHFGVHSNERPIKCDECDRTFKYKPQLYAHKLRHRGDKPHQCTTCGARFAFKTILNTHLKSHSSEKPFKCDECDLTFKYNSGLWTHKLIHKGEKPHQCTVCGSRFTLKGNLTGHMKTHTNEKPFECTLCGRKFPWRRNLRNHYKTHAKEQRVLEIQ